MTEHQKNLLINALAIIKQLPNALESADQFRIDAVMEAREFWIEEAEKELCQE